jgi:DNA-binding NarL/FixJ family response regulator
VHPRSREAGTLGGRPSDAHTWPTMTTPSTAPVRVLIVDDQAPFRLAAEQVVEATDGFQVVGAVASGEAAVAAVWALHPDLVLMDVHLPGIDGLEATRRILAGRDGPRRPAVLLLSTDEEDDLGPRVADCGAAGYIAKRAFGPRRLRAAWVAAR